MSHNRLEMVRRGLSGEPGDSLLLLGYAAGMDAFS